MTTNLIEQARLGKAAMGRLVLEASTGMHGAVAKQLALELAAALEQRADVVGKLPDEQFNVLAYEHADCCYRRGENTLSYEFTPEQLRAFCRAALAQQARPQWRTIDSAPKDGTSILLGFSGSHSGEGRWMGDATRNHWGEVGWFEYVDDVLCDHPSKPTHWMPLPEAPNE